MQKFKPWYFILYLCAIYTKTSKFLESPRMSNFFCSSLEECCLKKACFFNSSVFIFTSHIILQKAEVDQEKCPKVTNLLNLELNIAHPGGIKAKNTLCLMKKLYFLFFHGNISYYVFIGFIKSKHWSHSIFKRLCEWCSSMEESYHHFITLKFTEINFALIV